MVQSQNNVSFFTNFRHSLSSRKPIQHYDFCDSSVCSQSKITYFIGVRLIYTKLWTSEHQTPLYQIFVSSDFFLFKCLFPIGKNLFHRNPPNLYKVMDFGTPDSTLSDFRFLRVDRRFEINFFLLINFSPPCYLNRKSLHFYLTQSGNSIIATVCLLKPICKENS